MSSFTAIDLSKLPAPQVVETLDFEVILAQLKADLSARAPELAAALELESEPLTKLLEVAAYREIVLRARINDAARAVMLPHATGADLDNLAALYGVTRAILTPADETTTPPTPAVFEGDDRLRQRAQLALEGFSVAGPKGAYLFWGLNASPEVKDITVLSPTPGQVQITVLSALGDGTPDAALVETVAAALNAEEVRPLCDTVTVHAATIQPYTVQANLTLYDGPDTATVMASALASIQAYVTARHRLGNDVTISGLHAALHVEGAVQNVELISPTEDLVIGGTVAAYCDPETGITLTMAGNDV